MAKISLSKTIEATKLNRRTGFAESGPEVTIPFGGLVEHVSNDRGAVRFNYMGEPYRCSEDVWNAAIRDSVASGLSREGRETTPPVPSTPAPAAAPGLIWEPLSSSRAVSVYRTKVPGGWLLASDTGSLVFYPDAGHLWDGKTLA